jgi:hypothetical protein
MLYAVLPHLVALSAICQKSKRQKAKAKGFEFFLASAPLGPWSPPGDGLMHDV